MNRLFDLDNPVMRFLGKLFDSNVFKPFISLCTSQLLRSVLL